MDINVTAEGEVVTLIIPAKDPALTKRAHSLTLIADRIVVDSPDMFEAASDDLKSVKGLQKKLEEQRDSEVRPLNTKVREINDEYREPKEWLAAAESVLKNKMLTYQSAQERIAAEAQRRADEIARAEQARLRAEAAAQQAETNRLAAEARQREAERVDAERRAQQAEEAGDRQAQAAAQAEAATAAQQQAQAKAQVIEANDAALTTALEADIITAPAIVSSVRKVAGLSTSTTWKARVDNLAQLLHFIADHPECHDWIDVKMTPLNGMAKALKDNMQIPGVMAFESKTMAARAA